jgi:ribose transport system ATP-binding protein
MPDVLADMPQTPLLSVAEIVKSFPGVRALRRVELDVFPGEIVSVIGENGAGKSTLMKILAGMHLPDEGKLHWRGESRPFASLATKHDNAIALIHQELNLAGNLSIAANIFLGREPTRFGVIDQRRMNRDSSEYLEKVGLNLPPTTRVQQLSIGQQQMVEIAKALSTGAEMIIMDEPTSSLSTTESQRLFELSRQLRSAGVSIVYISHRLAEVAELSDRVVVLRDGENAGLLAGDDITHANMVRLMVGRELSQFFPHQSRQPGKVRLAVHELRVDPNFEHPIDLEVRAGEIVGLAGLVGAGRTEILQCIMGLRRALEGSVSIDGQPITLHSPRASISAGLAMVPEDRRHEGLMTQIDVEQNLSVASLNQRARLGFRSRSGDRNAAQSQVDSLKIKTPSLGQTVAFLSGGNQQKIVFGKWILCGPKVLLLDEPTRGVDIGAKQEIYGLMERLADEGVAILFVSSEMEEILGMSDRVLVMHEGRLSGELNRSDLSESAIMQLAVGSPTLTG